MLAGVVLVGAAAAFGIMWMARPTNVADDATPPATTDARATPTMVAVTGGGPLPAGELAKVFGPSVARVETLRDGTWTTSSALWVDDKGTLVAPTARVDGAETVMVVGTDGTRQPATMAGTDDATALSAITVGHTAGTPVQAAVQQPETGQQVSAIGCGLRDRAEQQSAVTMTPVVVRSTDERAMVGGTLLHGVIYLDRALPGDVDGGGLVDPSGHLLGLVVGNADDHHLGTVVPAATAIETALALRDDGRIQRAWLGVQVVDLDSARATMLDIDGGARLTEIEVDSPADAAGLQADDVVVAVGDHPVADASDMVMALRPHAPGDHASISVRRGAELLEVAVTLGG